MYQKCALTLFISSLVFVVCPLVFPGLFCSLTGRFVLVLALCVLLIFILISLRFGAAFIPFKLALTVCVPILFVFGLAVVVYQDGTSE
jgi:hypothetical protein